IQSVFKKDDLYLTRAAEGGYLMERIDILHDQFPWIWAVTGMFAWVFIWPFWSRVNWRRKSEYEIIRGDIEKKLVVREYERFKERYVQLMLDLTGRDDIWEENFHDMPFCNEPIVLKEQDYMRPGSVFAWARIHAKETSMDFEAEVVEEDLVEEVELVETVDLDLETEAESDGFWDRVASGGGIDLEETVEEEEQDEAELVSEPVAEEEEVAEEMVEEKEVDVDELVPEEDLEERHIYVVGEFFAKYWGERLAQNDPSDPAEYKVHPYAQRVTKAEFVEDPELPTPGTLNYMCPAQLQNVTLYFEKDPAGYGKPFRESFYEPIISDIRLEGVLNERKRSYGTMRGKFIAKVHTTVLPAREN
ncbi:MAG: hypothetical protein AAF570_25655, partial [Bacteroidota bacterium]